jgi:hypothetical protein
MGESSPEMISTDYLDSSALVKRYLAETGSVWVQRDATTWRTSSLQQT